MQTLTERQKEIVERIKADRKLNPAERSPKEWLLEQRTQARLCDMTRLLRTSTETLYALFNFYEIDGPKRDRRVVKTGYVNRDVAEVRRLLGQVRKGGKRARNAQQKLLERGIRYYTPEEADNLGIV